MKSSQLFKFVTLGSAKKDGDQKTSFEPIKYKPSGGKDPVGKILGASSSKRENVLQAVVEKNYIRNWDSLGLHKNSIREWMAKAAQEIKADPSLREGHMQTFANMVSAVTTSLPEIWASLYASTGLSGNYAQDIPGQVELIKFARMVEYLMETGKGLADFDKAYSKHVVVLSNQSKSSQKEEKEQPSEKLPELDMEGIYQYQQRLLEAEGALSTMNKEELPDIIGSDSNSGFSVQTFKSILKNNGLEAKIKSGADQKYISDRDALGQISQLKQENFRAGMAALKEHNRRSPQKVSISSYVRTMGNPVQVKASGTSKPTPSTSAMFSVVGHQELESLGVGTLYVVEEELLHYELAEISDIENVMLGEEKSRTFTSSTETEQYEETETQESTEVVQDNQVNESYALSSEVSKTIDTSFNTAASVAVSASYGVVSVGANASFGFSSNTSLTESSAQSLSKDIVSQTVETVASQTREFRSYRVTKKVMNESMHGFNNVGGDGHVRGIYRWLDKVSQIKLYDYGEREFYQFSIPEPSAIYQHYLEEYYRVTDEYLPEFPDFTSADIDLYNYLDLCSEYRVEDVPQPPREVQTVGMAMNLPSIGEGDSQDNSTRHVFRNAINSELVVPDGCMVTKVWIDAVTVGAGKIGNDEQRELHVVVGTYRWNKTNLDGDQDGFDTSFDYSANFTQHIPIAVSTYGLDGATINVTARFERTSDALDEWRASVYQAIVQSYERLKLAYDQAEAAAESNSETHRLRDMTSDEKDKVMIGELKRSCIDLLTRGDYMDYTSMNQSGDAAPFMRYNQAIKYGKYVSYFENCFEWDQMTYRFFPYFWSRESKWSEKLTTTDSDSLFSTFLSSGAAQIIVPVRPGYEKSVRSYVDSGSVIESLDIPIMDLEDYYALEETYQRPYEDIKLVDEWEVKYPTDLVYVQDAEEASSIIQEQDIE